MEEFDGVAGLSQSMFSISASSDVSSESSEVLVPDSIEKPEKILQCV